MTYLFMTLFTIILYRISIHFRNLLSKKLLNYFNNLNIRYILSITDTKEVTKLQKKSVDILYNMYVITTITNVSKFIYLSTSFIISLYVVLYSFNIDTLYLIGVYIFIVIMSIYLDNIKLQVFIGENT